jgi:hypothetical protein
MSGPPPARLASRSFPALVNVSRRMGLRPFELITISTDLPEDKAKAEAFLKKFRAGLPGHLKGGLEKEGRATNSYLYTEAQHGPAHQGA